MKLGIAGTGIIVQEVLPLLVEWGWNVTAICGTAAGKAEAMARAHGVPSAFGGYAAMLEQADIDTVYVAVPNFLHFDLCRKALNAGKHVIVEKPMTSNDREARELAALAREKNLFLFEAITTVYLPNYALLKTLLPRIGDVKIVTCNCSQYSRRYDAFRAGEILPVFDLKKSGGAMMDLNLYNLHWLIGLFGKPEGADYRANVERGIDTSGVLLLQYPGFLAVSIAAKDCAAPRNFVIQGTGGYIRQDSPANACREIVLHLNDGTEEVFDENPPNRLEPEFRAFREQIESGDHTRCYAALEHSVLVSTVQTQARLGAGIRFPADDVIPPPEAR